MGQSDNKKTLNMLDSIMSDMKIEVVRREKISVGRILVSSLLMLLPLLLILAPYLEPPGTVYLGNDGAANVIDHRDIIDNMSNPVARAVYFFGDWECHQHASRSFFLHGNQMPVCARCTSIFLFMGLTAVALVFFRVRISMIWIMLLIIPMVLDGGIQLVTPYESTNLMRFITGALAGAASVLAFDTIFEM